MPTIDAQRRSGVPTGPDLDQMPAREGPTRRSDRAGGRPSRCSGSPFEVPRIGTSRMSSTAGGLSVLGRSPPSPRCCPAPARRWVNARYVSHDAGDRLGFATFESCQAPVSERFPTSRHDRGGSCKSLTRKNDHRRRQTSNGPPAATPGQLGIPTRRRHRSRGPTPSKARRSICLPGSGPSGPTMVTRPSRTS